MLVFTKVVGGIKPYALLKFGKMLVNLGLISHDVHKRIVHGEPFSHPYKETSNERLKILKLTKFLERLGLDPLLMNIT